MFDKSDRRHNKRDSRIDCACIKRPIKDALVIAVLQKKKTVKMVDVVTPTTDGRVVTLPRYVEPKKDVAMLLGALGFTLPDQPPPKISSDVAAQKTEV